MLACTRSTSVRCIALMSMLTFAAACTDDPVAPNRLAPPSGAASAVNDPQPSPLGPPM